MKEKVILTDCDGVLLDWGFAFDRWMAKHKYQIVSSEEYNISKRYNISDLEKERLVRMFNESAWIRKLPPLRDAIKYVKKLHQDHGFIFHCISSLSDDDYAQHLRTKNLIETFGPTVFEKYIYLDTGADKDEVLKKYHNTECFWLEDKIENAELGSKLGLTSVLMEHDHNLSYNNEEILKVRNWKEIYNLITNN
jgi:FMN phosphatase YigB (HAD superfamily)